MNSLGRILGISLIVGGSLSIHPGLGCILIGALIFAINLDDGDTTTPETITDRQPTTKP
jgi:hypothetical protein